MSAPAYAVQEDLPGEFSVMRIAPNGSRYCTHLIYTTEAVAGVVARYLSGLADSEVRS